MNDNDKAGRYLFKCDPAGHLRWLLATPALEFHAWIDSRRVVLPNQKDLTQDLVAAVRSGDVLEAFCLELEAEARADALRRLLRYQSSLWAEPGGRESLDVSCAGGIILDLTGRSPARQLSLRSAIARDCGLEFAVLRRPLADADATAVLAGVAAGTLSPWVLGWVALMRGGSEAGIITQWRAEAERLLSDPRDRAELGLLTLTLAGLAACRPAWEHGLRGWNMQTSPLWDEIRAGGVRAMILRLGRHKFGEAPSREQQQALEAVTDLERLETLGERLLHAGSWAELLNGAE
jgi:hypothetical protein